MSHSSGTDTRTLVPYLKKLDTDPSSLSSDDIWDALDIILNSESIPDVQISAFLVGSRIVSRDHQVDFIHTAVKRLQKDARIIDTAKLGDGVRFVDIVGTGGDQKNTFNVSTTAAMVGAGMGLRVCKHGGPASTSKSGASDVLTSLGIDLTQINERTAPSVLKESKFCYLNGPIFHPVLSRTKDIRKNMAIPCIFNLVGPLLNPAPLYARVCGVYNPSLGKVYAEVIKQLNEEAGYPQGTALVVCGSEYLDEISTEVPTFYWKVNSDGSITEGQITPEDFGLERHPLSEVRSGTPQENAETVIDILSGNRKKGDAILDYVLLNSAALAVVSGIAKDWKEGVDLAYESITSGKALEALNALKKEVSKVQ